MTTALQISCFQHTSFLSLFHGLSKVLLSRYSVSSASLTYLNTIHTSDIIISASVQHLPESSHQKLRPCPQQLSETIEQTFKISLSFYFSWNPVDNPTKFGWKLWIDSRQHIISGVYVFSKRSYPLYGL